MTQGLHQPDIEAYTDPTESMGSSKCSISEKKSKGTKMAPCATPSETFTLKASCNELRESVLCI